MRECSARAFGPGPDARCSDIVQAAAAVADVPLSAMADTLLLPVTIPHSREAAGRDGGAMPPAGALRATETPDVPAGR